MKNTDFFRMENIVKQYTMGDEVQTILKGIDLQIEEGEFLSILGPSGSGKSTLMNIIGCLDMPTSGEYVLHGKLIKDMDSRQLSRIRNKEIGFIFHTNPSLKRFHERGDFVLSQSGQSAAIAALLQDLNAPREGKIRRLMDAF